MTSQMFFVAAATLLAAAPATAKDSAWLQKQIAQAKPGAVIVIPAGDYDLTDAKISRSMTLKGDGAVTLEEARAAGLDWNDDALAGFDLDSNGVLNEEEFKAAVSG